MKKIRVKIIIVVVLSVIFVPFNFSDAETIKINDMIFTVGKHEPQKRVNKVPKKYKNPKALEVNKQPAHGRELRLEETEEYIESHKKTKNSNNFEISDDLNSKKENLNKNYKDDIQKNKSEINSVMNSVFVIKNTIKDIFKKIELLKNDITDILDRLDNVENKLNLENESNNTKKKIKNKKQEKNIAP